MKMHWISKTLGASEILQKQFADCVSSHHFWSLMLKGDLYLAPVKNPQVSDIQIHF